MNENIKTNECYSCGILIKVEFEIKTSNGNVVNGYYKPLTVENTASVKTTDFEYAVVDFGKPITLNAVEFVIGYIKWYVDTFEIEQTLEKIRLNG